MLDAQFSNRLRDRLQAPLPGFAAQSRMIPGHRRNNLDRYQVPKNAKQSAVLILFYPGENGIHFPLIRRNAYEGVHSKQISFPGGRWEQSDGDLLTTALREAQEEVGVSPVAVDILGPISQLYIPPSNFLVQPYLGIAHHRPEFVRDPSEVAEIIEAPLSDFLSGKLVGESAIQQYKGGTLKVPSFTVDGHIVWGATAMMLSELITIVKESL